MATTKSVAAREQMMDWLGQQGYPTYAELLSLFDVYLTDDPEVVGYMVPGNAKIVLNKGLDKSSVSTVIRHEILHEYLTHAERQVELMRKQPDLTNDHQLANIAGDYEISNVGYTDEDKANTRRILLGNKVLRGLVTEDDHPDWSNKTFEEMYAELAKEQEKNQSSMQSVKNRSQQLNKKDLEDIDDMLDKMANPQQDSQSDSDKDSGKKNGDSADDEKEKSQKNSDAEGKEKKSSESPGQKSSEQNRKISKQASELGKEIDKVIDSLDKSGKDGEVFKDKEEIDDLYKRVQQIKDAFKDLKIKEKILSDTAKVKQKERAAKEAERIDRIRSHPLTQFKLSLDRFIQIQTATVRDTVEDVPNPAYEGTDLFVPYTTNVEKKSIPLINVYWDVSGSFSDPAKTQGARSAIATLNKYVKDGKIKTRTYYFADRVSSTPEGAGSGTEGTPVLDHILQTNPTNVIIITDGDISDCSEVVKVPGAVWMLFYDSESENLMEHLIGKRQTKYYLVQRNKYVPEGLDMKKYYVIRDKKGKQLSSPSLVESLLKERIDSMSKRGYQGLQVVEFNDEQVPESPSEGPSAGMATLLINAINDEWETINTYNDLIVTAEANGFTDMVPVIQDIVSEENVHVGQLQKVLSTISSNTDDISKGEDEAEEQLSNPVKTE